MNSTLIQVGFGPHCLTGSQVTITCDIEDGATEPVSFTWRRNGVMLSEMSRTLVVSMAGMYNCTAMNRYGSDSSTSEVLGIYTQL